jgi:hypothetical protein
MQLLISTPLHLFLLNPATGQTSTIRSGDGYYYGLTAGNGKVVLTHNGGYLQYFRSNVRPLKTINHLIQPHQVEMVGDQVVVANTGRNCLSVFDGNGNFVKDVYLNSIRFDDKEKNRLGNHFNSVHRQGSKMYLVAHNYERPSEVWTLTWPELEVIGPQASSAGWAHNIWIGEWGVVICDSKNGALHEVTSDKTIWKSDQQPLMTRGLAVSREHVFIGCSLHNPRRERFWKDGGVWILDRSSLRTIDKIILPGAGDVHDIRLVGCPDACHNDLVLNLDDLMPLKRISPIIQLAYRMRRLHPSLRHNFFPMSQIVRGVQMAHRLQISLTGRSRGNQLQ